jgi:DNA-directed RNA polymerase specialized sigma24 family protein
MNAVISGRAGVAILLQGDQLLSMDLDEPEELVPRRPDEYHLLIGDGTDLDFLEDVDLTAVRERLEDAVCREEALTVSLLLLDGELSDEIRTQAAEDLDECLAVPRALDSLEAVLYAAPLPEMADLPGALRCAQNQDQTVLPFLLRLKAQQPAIRTARQAWEALPEHFFSDADERHDAMTIWLRAGLFRDAARALADGGSPGSPVMQLLNVRPELDRFRKALAHWGELLSVQTSDDEDEETETDFLERLRDPTDPQVLVEFAERFSRRIKAWCLSKHFSVEITEEVMQELALSIRRRVPTYSRDAGTFKSWLHRVTINVAIDVLRKENAEAKKRVAARDGANKKAMAATDEQDLGSVVDDEVSRQILLDVLSGLLSRGEISRRDYNIFQQLSTARDHHEVVPRLGNKYKMSRAAIYTVKSRVRAQIKLRLEELDERDGDSSL